MTSTETDTRRRAERLLFFAYAELRRAEDAYAGDELSRSRLRRARLDLEAAETVAIAVLNFGGDAGS